MTNIEIEMMGHAMKLESQLCFSLYASSRLIVQAYAPVLNNLGITYPQYLVLLVLWEQDGQSVKEIGNKLYLDSGTLTPLLQKLETNKLVLRVRNPADDRMVTNQLTQLGKDLQSKVFSGLCALFGNSDLMCPDSTIMTTLTNEFITKVSAVVQRHKISSVDNNTIESGTQKIG